MLFRLVVIILAVAGLVDTAYIYTKTRQPQGLSCPMHTKCNLVLESEYNKTFGIKNEILGFLYYLFVLLVVVASWLVPQYTVPLQRLLVLTTGVGFLFSVRFVYLQAVVIKHYCPYCMTSAGLSVGLFVMSLLGVVI